jgi:orotate phosphoribosyltransferase
VTTSPPREQLVEIVRTKGLRQFDEPVQLASGELSRDFVDAKVALAHGAELEIACRAVLEAVAELGVEFDTVGGLTMGADGLAYVIAVLSGSAWFVVRKEPKNRGTNKLIEGSTLTAASRVLLVDDVVTTGGSIQKAHAAVAETGAVVVAAATIVDRGDVAGVYFAEREIPYVALVGYRDLGIEPVGRGLVGAS